MKICVPARNLDMQSTIQAEHFLISKYMVFMKLFDVCRSGDYLSANKGNCLLVLWKEMFLPVKYITINLFNLLPRKHVNWESSRFASLMARRRQRSIEGEHSRSLLELATVCLGVEESRGVLQLLSRNEQETEEVPAYNLNWATVSRIIFCFRFRIAEAGKKAFESTRTVCDYTRRNRLFDMKNWK